MEKLKKKPKNKSTITNDIPSAPTLDDFHVDPEATVTSLILPRTTEDVQPPSCPPLEDEEETSFTTEHFCEHEASAPLQDNLVLRRISEQRPEHLHSSIHKELNTMNPYINLSSSLTQMSPHQHLQGDLQYLDLEDKEVTTEVLDTNLNIDRGSDQLVIEQPSIVPFTESQLHALYHNAELEKNLEFVEHWLETQREIEKFPLDELLVNYLRVRTNLNSCGAIYDRGRSQVDDLIGELWQFSSDKIEEEGECDDENIVIVKREAKVATFNKSAGESLKNQFKECKETLVDNNSLFSFRSEVLRLKIEEFINSVIVRHQGMTVERPLVYSCEQEVRLTISVIFKFVRKDVEDKKFITDLRGWLDRMIGLTLAQSATLYEHLFLLNHIMRCPAGVGRWAAHYIQPAIPITDLEETSFDNPFLDHLITLLATILLPVKERLNFLHEFRIRAKRHVEEGEDEGEEGDKIWVVLDGEGSEDEDPKESWGQLRESDLIALFNQIPVDHMFRYVLRIEERDGTDQYNVKHSIQHSFLKLYAFSTQFVFLLREGLKTFNTPKYRQFAKRLGRLIRHTVHYVSDHWEGFRAENHNSLDPSMLIRLQTATIE